MKTTQKFNKRSVLLFIPLLILPVLALGFYALGGGEGRSSQDKQISGINSDLPDATFKDQDPVNKMGFYLQSEKDSIRQSTESPQEFGFNPPSPEVQTFEINQKLEALNNQISSPDSRPFAASTESSAAHTSMKNDIDRLEELMKINKTAEPVDPEIAQLSEMMDKIIAIQNPTLISEKIKDLPLKTVDSSFKAIPAEVESTQRVKQGGLVKLKLLDSINYNGIIIPSGHLIFASCQITNQRLLLHIKNIRLGTSIIPVDLSVFAMDGLQGIDAPEAELAVAGADGTANAIQGMQLISMDQSIGAQAAGAGIQAAKGLFGKKLKKLKIKLQGGQPILLKQNK
jgi:hypothetical protein